MEPVRPQSRLPLATPPGERAWVAVLCVFAAVHVFVYSAAFPFFGNVDESQHFDTVVKYSTGKLPRRVEPFSAETVRMVALFDSTFYFGTNNAPELQPAPWSWPLKHQAAWVAAHFPVNPPTNYETTQPPLYYVAAGSWWNLAGQLGVNDGNRLYGLRFLNVPVMVLIVFLGWLTARQVFPESLFHRLAVPAFLAVFPQGTFYSIENDVLSPLFFGIAFLGLLRFWAEDVPSVGLGVVTGLALAAAFLAKITNVFPIAAFLLVIATRSFRYWQRDKLVAALPSLAVFCVSAGLPALAWMTWCKVNFGDFTGSQPKADYWGWTPKPFLEWWHHPIFTPHGAAKFLDHFLPQLWQGEFIWHLKPLAFRPVDMIYTVVTMGLLALPLVKMTLRPAEVSRSQSRALWMSFFFFASASALLVFISISFDFHDCPNPSRDVPYLFCGRQVLAALIPFLLLFVAGLHHLLARLADARKFLVLAAILFAMLTVEAAANWPAFSAPYNWFHM